MAAEIAGSIIAAASGLLGVAVGGYFTVLNQKRERRQQRISVQLAEFYSPMLGLRFDVLARSELRLKLNGTADATWRKMMHEAQEIGVEHLTRVNKERFPVFEKIIEDDNRQFAEVIMPAYRKMLELFTSKM